MMRLTTRFYGVAAGLGIALLLSAQQPDLTLKITGQRGKLRIAVPEFRGPGVKPDVLQTFNTTLWNDLESSGVFEMVSKSFYPTDVVQRPEDFKPPIPAPVQPPRRLRPGEKPPPPPEPKRQGPWLTDWSQPPVTANVLAFGSTSVDNDRFALSGWLYDVTKPDVGAAHIFGKR